MLNPETSSDSLSVKSKGVRPVSAKRITIHTGIVIIAVKITIVLFSLKVSVAIVSAKTSMAKTMMDSDTSYEIA